MVEVRGLEGLVNGFIEPLRGLLGTRMLYESEICRGVTLWGLEGLINGLPKPTTGLLGTRMLYETKKG